MTTTPIETANAEPAQLKLEWSKPELIQLNTDDAQGKNFASFEIINASTDFGPS